MNRRTQRPATIDHAAVWIGTRVSDPKQLSGYSLEGQDKQLKGYAAKQGWRVDREYPTEKAESGFKQARPTLDRLIADLKVAVPRPARILFWTAERFGRNTPRQEQFVEQCHALGVWVHVADIEHDLHTLQGRRALKQKGAPATDYSLGLRIRMVEARAAAAAAGRWASKPRFGYRTVEGRRGRPELDPTVAPALREAVALFAAGATHADAYGLLERRLGADLACTANAFHRNLQTPEFYAGRYPPLAGQRALYDGELPAPAERALWATLIDDETYAKLLARIGRVAPGEMPGETRGEVHSLPTTGTRGYVFEREDFPLKSVLVCEGCGRRVTASWSRSKNGTSIPITTARGPLRTAADGRGSAPAGCRKSSSGCSAGSCSSAIRLPRGRRPRVRGPTNGDRLIPGSTGDETSWRSAWTNGLGR